MAVAVAVAVAVGALAVAVVDVGVQAAVIAPRLIVTLFTILATNVSTALASK